MTNRIALAEGSITETDKLRVELIANEDRAMCLLVWPQRPTPVRPAKLAETVAIACRVLSNAVIELAGLRGKGKRW
jgi:hypothetical protein